jgi:hypothetical protein
MVNLNKFPLKRLERKEEAGLIGQIKPVIEISEGGGGVNTVASGSGFTRQFLEGQSASFLRR